MFLTLFSVFTFFIFWYKIRWQRCKKYINKVPGPPVSFFSIIGNIPQFYGSCHYMWLMLRKLSTSYYPIWRLWSVEEPIVGIMHPDDVGIVLSSTQHITKASPYDLLHVWLRRGLLTSTGEKWRNRRKLLTPAFHFNVLNHFTEVFQNESVQLVNFIKNSGREIHDVIPILSRLTLNSVCETVMGTRFQGNDQSQEEYRSATHYVGSTIFQQLIQPWTKVQWFFKLLPNGRKQVRALRILHNFSTRIIENRKKYHEENKLEDFESLTSDNGGDSANISHKQKLRKRVGLLDLLISLWKCGEIDDIGIREEVDTFIFEGHDTTTSGLVFAVLLIAEHKEIQEKARKEVDEVFEKCGGKLGMQELQDLTYLDRCIKEALRLYPSVPSIGRVAAEDVKLSGYLIPKGTVLTLLIYDLHRNPNFWPNPHEYDPDRFLPDVIKKRHPYSYIPFSAGPRNCIGQKFAMLELKSAMAHLLHNFEMEALDKAGDARILMDVVIRCDHPLRIKFSPVVRAST